MDIESMPIVDPENPLPANDAAYLIALPPEPDASEALSFGVHPLSDFHEFTEPCE
jgi:hypothetical protein